MNDRVVHILHFYADSLSHPQFMNDWSFINCKDAMERARACGCKEAFTSRLSNQSVAVGRIAASAGAPHCVPAGSWRFVKKLLACLAHVEWGREMNIASKVGSRIRTLREAAGLTQSELAATAYVTRQSVGNWERGNTLPDVQSLQLVAKALNTTVDGLLGDELPDMLEETAEARRQLTHCLAALGAIFALELLLVFLYSSFLRAPGSGEFRLVLSGMRVVLCFASMPIAKRFRSIASGQDLGDAISIMMFVEGYPKGKEPPATWFYRVLLTNLPAFYTFYIVLLAAALIAVAYA